MFIWTIGDIIGAVSAGIIGFTFVWIFTNNYISSRRRKVMSNGQTHGGKGSATRPTDKKKYEDNWDVIFGKKKEKKTLEEILNQIEKETKGDIE